MEIDLDEDAEQVKEEKYASSHELADNVVEDLIEYSRGNIIYNEQQFLLINLGWITGWFKRPEHYVNEVLIGTAGGGKSHIQQQALELYEDEWYYQATDGSDQSIINDSTWDNAKFASLDEINKLSEKLLEILKGVSGDDKEYVYKRTKKTESGDYTTEEIKKEAKPYSFLYAQFDLDHELNDRLFKCYIEESEDKNRLVGRMQADHENISVGNGEYIYDTTEIRKAITGYLCDLPDNVVVRLPEWIWHSLEPIFEHSRSESNRIYSMVFNLIRASALLNYKNREHDIQTVDGEAQDVIIAEAQDVANILSCRKTLVGTTHKLEPRKLEIIDAIEKEQGISGEVAGCTIDDIQRALQGNEEISTLSKSQLKNILEELEENFFIDIHRGAGSHGAHLYEFNGISELGMPRLTGLSEHNDGFPDSPYDGCKDPIKNIDFTESQKQFREKYIKNSAGIEQFMSGSDDDDSQAALTDNAKSREDFELTDFEEAVLDRIKEVDGSPVKLDVLEPQHLVASEAFEKLTQSPTEVSFTGTLVDPQHGAWDSLGKRAESINDESDTVPVLQDTIESLQERGVFEIEKRTDSFGKVVVHV